MSRQEDPALIRPTFKPCVDSASLAHRELRNDPFWKRIPAYRELEADEFHDHRFQSRNCITSVNKLKEIIGELVTPQFYQDVVEGVRHSTMSLRISPYIISLIDWERAYDDPLRIQFLPVASRFEPDHPELTLDSLHEQIDSPVPGLTHRYLDRALFLALDTCPVYCRFCTRSYAVGLDTEDVEKVHFGVNSSRWETVFEYIASRPELEDIVISGGDTYNLKADHIEHIGDRLLAMDHIRRMRFATKGPAVMPQKLLTDDPWIDALTRVVEKGRRQHKEVVLHTHFNHPNEMTAVTGKALDRLAERGIVVRNQTVLQRRVNDRADTMQLLVRRLGYLNVQPYYVFVHDMVKGVEELRTTLETAIELEKQVRGLTSGFNTPTFILDTMGGGGKRNVHSYEHYDRENGIAVYTSPTVRPGELFLYFDPLAQLGSEARQRWQEESLRRDMIEAALQAAGKID
jgi:lysine 2,3-aminomutase